jgi:hypothetical protein
LILTLSVQIIDFGFARRLIAGIDVIAGQGTPEFVSPGDHPLINNLNLVNFVFVVKLGYYFFHFNVEQISEKLLI